MLAGVLLDWMIQLLVLMTRGWIIQSIVLSICLSRDGFRKLFDVPGQRKQTVGACGVQALKQLQIICKFLPLPFDMVYLAWEMGDKISSETLTLFKPSLPDWESNPYCQCYTGKGIVT